MTKDELQSEIDALNEWREDQTQIYVAKMRILLEQKELYPEDRHDMATLQNVMVAAETDCIASIEAAKIIITEGVFDAGETIPDTRITS